MIYNLHIEIAATIFLLILIVVIYTKKQLPTRTNYLFKQQLWLLLLANILGSIQGLASEGMLQINLNTQRLLNTADAALGIIVLANYVVYLLSMLYMADFHKRWFWILMLPPALLVIAAITSPWHGLYYSIDETGQLQRGILSVFTKIITLGYLFGSAVLMAIKRSDISKRNRLLMTGGSALLVFADLMQQYSPWNVRLLYPLFALLAFAGLLVMQSPDFYTDDMTGLYNLNAFMEVLKENVGYHKPTHCLLVKINNYNTLVRVYRHDHLNRIRKNIADLLLTTKARGHLYRISSSTFVVICDDAHQVEIVHQVMLEELPGKWKMDGETITQNYNFYQLEYNGDDADIDKLRQWINYARSEHKSHHEPGELIPLKYDTLSEAEKEQEVSRLIDQAILDQSMELHMQPVYSLSQKRITSLEILSRMKDQDGKYINPEFFIHVAEGNRTIVPLGELIFRRACIFAKQYHIFDLGIEYMNINVSPGQCQYEGLTEQLVAIAKEYEIPMERIHVEITESEFQDPKAVERTLTEIRDAGMKIALDDFGTGCSTLLSILEMPVDYVKIDKSLVWSYDAGDNRFLDDLMPVIRAEGKQVIAEGIETEDHIDIFRRLDGDYLQGYYFSKPLPEQEFVSYVKRFNFGG